MIICNIHRVISDLRHSIICVWRLSVTNMGGILGRLALSGSFSGFFVAVEGFFGLLCRFGGFLCAGMGGCAGIFRIFVIFKVFSLFVTTVRSSNSYFS